MSSFLCPVCRESLAPDGNTLKCSNGHSFDRSSAGDVYLLRSSKSEHGDSLEMVRARRDFLDRGYYSHLAEALADLAVKYVNGDKTAYFDAGCGTGYYTERVWKKLCEKCECTLTGIDISKHAVRMCSKRMKSGEFAVASVYDLPLEDSSFDLVTNVFSPQAESEFARILKPQGTLLYVVPAPKHLFSMKQVLYENPYENDDRTIEYEGFHLVERVECERVIELEGSDIESLFRMTPYFWRTSREGSERLISKTSLSVEASFYIYVFKKDEA